VVELYAGEGLLGETDAGDHAHHNGGEEKEHAHDLTALRVAQETVERYLAEVGRVEIEEHAAKDRNESDQRGDGHHLAVLLREEQLDHEQQKGEAAEHDLGATAPERLRLARD